MGKEKVITKTVKFGEEERTVEIHMPTPKIEAEANMYSSQVFAKLVKSKDEDGNPNYILRAQLNDFMKDAGIYTDEDIKAIEKLGEKIASCEKELSTGGKTKSQGRKIAIDLRSARYQLLMLLAKRLEYDKNTVEHYAANARMDFLISKCITYEGGVKIFNTVEDYQTDSFMHEALAEVVRDFANMVSDYDPDFDRKLPENKFLLKFGFCNEDLDLVNSDGQKVDEDGDLIDDEGFKIDNTGRRINSEEFELGEFLDDEELVPTEQEEVKS